MGGGFMDGVNKKTIAGVAAKQSEDVVKRAPLLKASEKMVPEKSVLGAMTVQPRQTLFGN